MLFLRLGRRTLTRLLVAKVVRKGRAMFDSKDYQSKRNRVTAAIGGSGNTLRAAYTAFGDYAYQAMPTLIQELLALREKRPSARAVSAERCEHPAIKLSVVEHSSMLRCKCGACFYPGPADGKLWLLEGGEAELQERLELNRQYSGVKAEPIPTLSPVSLETTYKVAVLTTPIQHFPPEAQDICVGCGHKLGTFGYCDNCDEPPEENNVNSDHD